MRSTARQLEQFRLLVRDTLNLRADPTRPVVVLIVGGKREMKEMLPGSRPDVPGGFFMKGGPVHYIVLREFGAANAFGVVYHEYVHLLNDLNFGVLPMWLNEGLAEFYRTAEIEDDHVAFAKISPRHLEVLKNGTTLPLARLFALDEQSPEYTGAAHGLGMVYAQSAALTHYLMMDEKGARPRQLAEFLNQLSRGATSQQAVERAFGDAEALDKAFQSYVRQFQFYSVRVPGSFDVRTITSGPLGEAEALAFRADYATRIGRVDEAEALVGRALAVDPSSGAVQRALGLVRAAQERSEEARAAFERATRAMPDDLLAHYYLGTTRDSPETPEARARRESALLRAIQLKPTHAPSLGAMSDLALEAGRKEEAVTRAAAARRAEPREIGWGLRLARALREAERAQEADALESALVASAQSDARVLYEAMTYFDQNGRKAEAAALLARVQAGNERGTGLQRALGNLFYAAGRFDEAETAYRAALAQNGNDAQALHSLGYMNADRNLRVPEALAMIESALKQSPDSAFLLDSRGWALFRLGRLAEAEKDLRRAAAGLPEAVVLDHLAEVLAARGARDEAAATWRKALADPGIGDDLKAAIERRLAPASPAP